ncbi:type III secretion system export apparatus subunit SctS [Desulfothermus sp.]
MNEIEIIHLTIKGVTLILILSLPAIIVASILGFLVSLIQALTQIQDQTISFGVKLIGVVITLIVTAKWVGQEIFIYAQNIFDKFPYLLK